MEITLIAVGNGGYNIANDIIEAGIISPTHYLVCETDIEELQNKKQSTNCKTIPLPLIEDNPEPSLTHHVEGIVPVETDLVLICAGMGGITGSHYAPQIGMSAQILNKKVISIFAIAFQFEGENAQSRSKCGFLQQQIASDLCICQDNNWLLNESVPDEMNQPLVNALQILKKKYPISHWEELSASEIRDTLIETSRTGSPVMIPNFYSKKFTDIETRKRMFNEIITINPKKHTYMTTDLYQFNEEPIIAILGLGKDSKKYIDEIQNWVFPLVSAKMIDRDFTGPGEGVEMVILIITENVDATILAKNLKQSGILTLIVATCEIRAMEGSYDSMAMVSENKVMETVWTVADILNGPPNCICNGFDDWWCSLKDSETFHTFLYTSSFEGGSLKDHMNYLTKN